MKKLNLLVACIILASCAQNNEEIQKEAGIEKMEYRFQDGTTAKIEYDHKKNIINKDSDSYKKIISFIEHNPNYNMYLDKNNTILLSPSYESMISFTTQGNNNKGVVQKICSGWFKLYDNNDYTGLLYENTTNETTDYAFGNLNSMGIDNRISSVITNNCMITLYLDPSFMINTSFYYTPTLTVGGQGTTVQRDLSKVVVIARNPATGAGMSGGLWADKTSSMKVSHICYVTTD